MAGSPWELWQYAQEHLERGRNVLLAVVGEASRHSPGTAGAMMWISEDGSTYGTIGGGAMELRLQERARSILDRGEDFFEVQELQHRRASPTDEPGIQPSGMICAGRQTNVLYVCRPDRDLETIKSFAQQSRRTQQKDGDVGGWTLGQGGLRRLDDGASAGRTVLKTDGSGHPRLEQGFGHARRAAIVGGGHCGKALAELLAGLGYAVAIWDIRPSLVETLIQDGLDAHRISDFQQAGAEIERPSCVPMIVMTPDVPNDVRALAGALRRGFPFLGVMGSRSKLEEIFRRLKMLGFEDEELQQITAPVGLPIGSRAPREIAVSVAAQLLSLRPGWETG